MLRLRLAFLTLASGLLVTMSGCMNSNPCSQSRMFSRLFGGTLTSRPSALAASSEDCECHNSYMPSSGIPSGIEGGMMHGPQMIMPAPTPIPTTSIPMSQAPPMFKIPQAAPLPYAPTH
jgi:hypothetical protein